MMRDFDKFFDAMKAEYERHVPLKGDTWRTCDVGYLWNKLQMISYVKVNDTDHLLDIANMCAMIWSRYQSSEQVKT